MFRSTGPWPMSHLPVHEPTSVFIRSNSGELALAFSVSPAFAPRDAARINAVSSAVIFVFIFVRCSIVVCNSNFIYTTNGLKHSGQLFSPHLARHTDHPAD